MKRLSVQTSTVPTRKWIDSPMAWKVFWKWHGSKPTGMENILESSTEDYLQATMVYGNCLAILPHAQSWKWKTHLRLTADTHASFYFPGCTLCAATTSQEQQISNHTTWNDATAEHRSQFERPLRSIQDSLGSIRRTLCECPVSKTYSAWWIVKTIPTTQWPLCYPTPYRFPLVELNEVACFLGETLLLENETQLSRRAPVSWTEATLKPWSKNNQHYITTEKGQHRVYSLTSTTAQLKLTWPCLFAFEQWLYTWMVPTPPETIEQLAITLPDGRIWSLIPRGFQVSKALQLSTAQPFSRPMGRRKAKSWQGPGSGEPPRVVGIEFLIFFPSRF